MRNATGHALLDPEPLISPEQAVYDREQFLLVAAQRRPGSRRSAQQRRAIINRIVELVKVGEVDTAELAFDYSVSENTVRAWVKRAHWLIEQGEHER